MHQICLRNILLLLMFSIMGSMAFISPNAAALTAEEKQAKKEEKQIKKDNKNLASIEKQLIIIEEQLEEEYGGKNALKASKSANRTYKRLSDSAKEASEKTGFTARLNELTEKSVAKSKRDPIVKKDLKYLKRATDALDKLPSLLACDTCHLRDAQKELRAATGIFKKISETSLKETKFTDVEARINEMTVLVEGEGSRLDSEGMIKLELVRSQQSYETYVYNKPMLVSFALANGLATQLDETYGFKDLKEAYDAADFEQLETTFKEEYATLIEHAPDYHQGRTLSPTQILDIYKNIVQYRDNYIIQNGKNHLNEKIEELNKFHQILKEEDGRILFDLSDLYGAKANAQFDIINEIKEYYDWAGQTLPTNEVEILSEYKETIRNTIEEVSSDNEWPSSEYPYKDDRIEKIAKDLCIREHSTFVRVGMTGENSWSINKNALDIPTSRDQHGLMLCQHPDEPFKRGYLITLNAVFNGVGYEPINSGSTYRSPAPYK